MRKEPQHFGRTGRYGTFTWYFTPAQQRKSQGAEPGKNLEVITITVYAVLIGKHVLIEDKDVPMSE